MLISVAVASFRCVYVYRITVSYTLSMYSFYLKMECLKKLTYPCLEQCFLTVSVHMSPLGANQILV